jgi:hypothetical protein
VQPADLNAASFSTYPPQARTLALAHLALLRQLPLLFVPLLLREWISYDWRLPAERTLLDRQILVLSELPAPELAKLLAGFRSLTLSPKLLRADWVSDPAQFMELLTAFLWSSHQMERFRTLATDYQAVIDRQSPAAAPRQPRLGLVAIGAGASSAKEPLFSKLKPYGTHFTAVQPIGGWQTLQAKAAERAQAQAQGNSHDFRHWLISGFSTGSSTPGLVTVSYAELQNAREALLRLIGRAMNSGSMGPEEMRSLLARLTPADVGLAEAGDAGVLNRFQLSLLTEGSGTQIFATTFVQWAARECIRRAEPETVLLRFSPRQQERSLNEMLMSAGPRAVDAAGSLVDADMAAYYTWIELRRLGGSEDLRFLVWHEDHAEALLVGPGLPGGTTSDSAMKMDQLLKLLA